MMSRRVILKGNNFNPDPANGSGTGHSEHSPAESPYRFELNLIELARVIFEKRRLVVGASFAIMVITAVYLLLQPNLFTSSATILPSGKSTGLSDLKSLVGLGGSFSTPDENSSIMYPVVLNSNLIVDAVLGEEYSFVHKSKPMSTTLDKYFSIENRDRLRTALRTITSIRSDNQTGEIRVGVETEYPALSQAILLKYLTQLEDFNRNKRRSSARDNEQYLARQLVAARENLQEVEDNLEAYQMTNLDWAITGSPEILKELGRLQREVMANSATYTLLTQEHAMAKLETQKDIPIIRVLDAPSMPTIKSGPFRRNLIILSGVISFMLICLTVIIRHLVRQAATASGHDDVQALRHDLERAFPRTRTTFNRIKSTVREKTPLIHS
jgi:uncharacterized protein involved in exopolysaccharide biosynthesis